MKKRRYPANENKLTGIHISKFRFLLTCLVLFFTITGNAFGASFNIDIPSQEADLAFRALAKQTDYNMIYAIEELGNPRTQAVVGTYTAEQALKLMLKDTGLNFKVTGEKTVIIKKMLPPATLPTKAQPGSEEKTQNKAESHNDFMLENTIITASKREVKVQSIPMSIQALTGENLEKIGAVGFEDFATRIPGLTIKQEGTGINSLQIRGVASLTDTGNSTATVGYYINDTPISSALHAPDAALFDLERIEVLKGPQGTLYGEGSLGGTVRLITRKPQMNEFEGKVQVAASHTENSPGYNYQTNAVINAPIIDDRLAFRLAGSFNNSDGFVDDINSGDDGTNDYQKSNIRAVLRIEPSDQLAITPSVIYQKIEGGSPNWDSPLYPDLVWFRQLPQNEGFDDESLLFALDIKFDFEWAELVSNTSYYDRELASVMDRPDLNADINAVLDGTGFTSPYTQLDDSTQTETFCQELRLVSTGKGPLSWVVGGFYRDRQTKNHMILNNDLLGLLIGNEKVFENDVEQRSKQIAVFGEVNYNILENLILTCGTRWFQEDIKGSALYETIGAPPDPFQLVGGTTQSNLTEEDLLFKLALAYNPADNVMLYSQFTQGVRAGGTNGRAVDLGFGVGADVDLNFYSDSTNNFEAGIKSDWFNGRFRANAAYYYIDWKDIQVVDEGTTGQIFIVNAARACSTGFELELAGQPASGLTLGMGMAYSIAAEITEETIITDGTIPDGATIPFSPELSGSVFVEYAFPVRENLTGVVGADVQYMDEVVTEIQTESVAPTPLDAYHTINFRAGVTAEDWDLHIFVTNVTDVRAEMSQTLAPSQGTTRNRPRTIGLQFMKNF